MGRVHVGVREATADDAPELAGFAVVERDEEDTWRMDHFFVLRKHRQRGIGRRVALELFRRFPGGGLEESTRPGVRNAVSPPTITSSSPASRGR